MREGGGACIRSGLDMGVTYRGDRARVVWHVREEGHVLGQGWTWG